MASPPVISLEDYDAIAGAVMETERGRWFLAEFARRNRAADTQAVLEALAAVEARLAARPVSETTEAPSPDVVERISAAAQIAKRLRMDLAASNRQGRFFTRTSAQIEQIERELTAVLKALRPGAEPAAATAEDTPQEPARTALARPDPREDARKAAEARRLADLEEELARPIEVEPDLEILDVEAVAEILAVEAVPSDRTEPVVHRPAAMERERLAVVETALSSVDEPPLNGAAYEPRRGALPKAWTPSLLDSLSETEKAMLFA